MDSTTTAELAFGCKDIKNKVFDFLLPRCPVCSTKTPINWQSYDWETSIGQGFCSDTCGEKFTKMSKILTFKNPATTAMLDKKLVTRFKALLPCKDCCQPFTPRQSIEQEKTGGTKNRLGKDPIYLCEDCDDKRHRIFTECGPY